MTARGLASHIQVVPGGESQLDGMHAAEALLARDPLPTAGIAYNDDVAVAEMNALALHGVAVPQEVSFVGWDDNEIARLSHVDLTSVAQDPHRLPGAALERVLGRADGRELPGRGVVPEPELRIRSSTTTVRSS